MRNVTITMDEDVARWARIEAAKRDTSLARFLGELLKGEMERERAYEEAMAAFLACDAPLGGSGGRLPRRDEVHDRAALRR